MPLRFRRGRLSLAGMAVSANSPRAGRLSGMERKIKADGNSPRQRKALFRSPVRAEKGLLGSGWLYGPSCPGGMDSLRHPGNGRRRLRASAFPSSGVDAGWIGPSFSRKGPVAGQASAADPRTSTGGFAGYQSFVDALRPAALPGRAALASQPSPGGKTSISRLVGKQPA